MMRIGLFILTKLAVVIVASIVMSILGVEPYLQQSGPQLTSQHWKIASPLYKNRKQHRKKKARKVKTLRAF